MPTDRPTIYAIDFDGTIANTDFPTILEPRQPVVDFIRALQKRGDKWILWTMREGDVLVDALAWCGSHGLEPDAVNDNLPELKEKWGNNPRKVFADVYIDDHNAGGMFLPTVRGDEEPQPLDFECCGNCKWMARIYEECLCEHPTLQLDDPHVRESWACSGFEQTDISLE